jgi:hypothetical protein
MWKSGNTLNERKEVRDSFFSHLFSVSVHAGHFITIDYFTFGSWIMRSDDSLVLA